jgi:hypothetical protein
VAQQPNSGLGRLTALLSRSHTTRNTRTHARTVGLLHKRDQLVAEAATRTTHRRHNGRTLMPSTGFERTMLGVERPQTAPPPGSTTF